MLTQGYFKPPALCHNLVQGFSISALQTFGAGQSFVLGTVPWITECTTAPLGLYLLDASSTLLPTVLTKKHLQTFPKTAPS